MNHLTMPTSLVVALMRHLTRSDERERAILGTMRDILASHDELKGTLRMAIQELTVAVNNTVDVIQQAVDELAAHATDKNDPALIDLTNRLNNAVSSLSTAVTRHGADTSALASPSGDPTRGPPIRPDAPGTVPGDTVAGTGALGSETVVGASAVSGSDTVSGGGNDTVSGGTPTAARAGRVLQGGVENTGTDTGTSAGTVSRN